MEKQVFDLIDLLDEYEEEIPAEIYEKLVKIADEMLDKVV